MFRALIVSQHMEERLRLQHALEQAREFREVVSVHDLEEALLLLTTTAPWDLIFVSDKFGETEAAPFIGHLRRSIGGANSTLIQLSSTANIDKDSVANCMILGYHGFICSPYSLDAVHEAVKLAGNVRLQGSQLRLKAATGLMLTDTIAAPEGPGSEGDTWDKVQRTWDEYKRVTGESLTLAVVDALHKLSPAKRLPNYNGVSQRVRGLFKKSVQRNLDHGKRSDIPEKR